MYPNQLTLCCGQRNSFDWTALDLAINLVLVTIVDAKRNKRTKP